LDEVHFVTNDVARRRGISPIGEPIMVVRSDGFAESYSITALTRLDSATQPIVLSEARETSNTQMDFIKFVYDCICNQHLVAGDILILDNASIHGGLDTFPILQDLLTAAQVKMVYLPSYSPELNPIELVFGYVKRFLRDRRGDAPLLFEIICAFFLVDCRMLENFYSKCLSLK